MPEDIKEKDLTEMTEPELAAEAFRLSASVPWQYDTSSDTYRGTSTSVKGADGEPLTLDVTDKEDDSATRRDLQNLCWWHTLRSPQVNTALRGTTGRISGAGFSVSSEIKEIQEAIDEIELDYRNRLYNFWSKYTFRSLVEGELFLCITCHNDGFCEVDFVDPSSIAGMDDDTGILFHPTKGNLLPLIYNVKFGDKYVQIPSIFVARNTSLLGSLEGNNDLDQDSLAKSKVSKKKNKKLYNAFDGFYRFIVSFDKSAITKRNVGHARTIIKWVRLWETLKEYEIDHKKSSGAYLWVITFDSYINYIEWLKLSDEDRAKTGIVAKKTPGSTLVLGPGMQLKAQNPTLPKISDSDTDIMHQITAGLNESDDVTSGNLGGATYASLKAVRPSQSDRIQDEISYFEKFLRYDFWANIFFLKSKINGFPEYFKRKEPVDFKNGNVIEKMVKRRPDELIDIAFPTSEISATEDNAKALLGVKHGSLQDTLGIPYSEIAKRLGFGNYRSLRLQNEFENNRYPELISTEDDESFQEQNYGEKKVTKKTDKKMSLFIQEAENGYNVSSSYHKDIVGEGKTEEEAMNDFIGKVKDSGQL